MIPIVEYTPVSELPAQASFWMPTEDDIPDDEGLGYFRDVWMILNEPIDCSRRVIETEKAFIEIADRVAKSEEEFEIVSRILETGDIERLNSTSFRNAFGTKELNIVDWSESDDPPPLGNLELGVAGVAYALSTIGAVPVASCRGHKDGWSDLPVVYAAIDEQRARWLQPIVQDSECGFHIGLNREEFLAIEGPSVRHMNQMAHRILSLFAEGEQVFARWIDLDLLDARYD
ncbi:hypothetical protein ACFV3N_20935 [Streptomyces bauhiniae]|uniref:hypothetical protein n=1 Tax=Streptomyces bauhiniae TaxID=2340725 RepID=UPI00365A2E9B